MSTDELILRGYIPHMIAARASMVSQAEAIVQRACLECRGMTPEEFRQSDAFLADAARLTEAIDQEKRLSSAAGTLHSVQVQ